MKDVKEFSLSDCAEFEAQIGYQFQNKKLLVEALTHSSYANEGKKHLHNF